MNALPFLQFHPARVRARRIRCMLLLVGLTSPVLAEVTLPGCLSDHMVLQQQSQVSIWGWADPGEAVTVAPGWSAMPTVTRADPDGRLERRVARGPLPHRRLARIDLRRTTALTQGDFLPHRERPAELSPA